MTYKNKYAISAILKKLGRDYDDWELASGASVIVTYKRFRQIMMLNEDVEPVITYERTAREKYQLLKDLGFINDSGRVYIDAVQDFLNINPKVGA